MLVKVVNFNLILLAVILMSCNDNKLAIVKKVEIHDYLLDESKRYYKQPSFAFYISFDESYDYEIMGDGFFVSNTDTVFLSKVNFINQNTFLFITKGNRLWNLVDLKNVNNSSKDILENMSLHIKYKSELITVESQHSYSLTFLERPAIKINVKRQD